jgi:tetratricopeptide (TPR) repeat protein
MTLIPMLILSLAGVAARATRAADADEIVQRTFKAGNDAMTARNYDEAIKQYTEGLAADPDQVAILINLGLAYRARGVDRYNAAIALKDAAARSSGQERAKEDFRKAADATGKAVGLIKARPASSNPAVKLRQAADMLVATRARWQAMQLFVVKVDATKGDDGIAACREYMACETDPAKKEKAQKDGARLEDAGYQAGWVISRQ